MTDRFSAAVLTGGEMPVVALSGQLDRDAEADLLAAYERASESFERVAIDFSKTGYINSTGLAVLVQLLARARASGTEIHAFGLSDHYREIFAITRLADFVTIHAEPGAA
jgi:anti-sigma B factor antagonist